MAKLHKQLKVMKVCFSPGALREASCVWPKLGQKSAPNPRVDFFMKWIFPQLYPHWINPKTCSRSLILYRIIVFDVIKTLKKDREVQVKYFSKYDLLKIIVLFSDFSGLHGKISRMNRNKNQPQGSIKTYIAFLYTWNAILGHAAFFSVSCVT